MFAYDFVVGFDQGCSKYTYKSIGFINSNEHRDPRKQTQIEMPGDVTG